MGSEYYSGPGSGPPIPNLYPTHARSYKVYEGNHVFLGSVRCSYCYNIGIFIILLLKRKQLTIIGYCQKKSSSQSYRVYDAIKKKKKKKTRKKKAYSHRVAMDPTTPKNRWVQIGVQILDPNTIWV
ncbi:hypothetical protein AMTRI_Chr12g267920 [Amborella trichopoda]